MDIEKLRSLDKPTGGPHIIPKAGSSSQPESPYSSSSGKQLQWLWPAQTQRYRHNRPTLPAAPPVHFLLCSLRLFTCWSLCVLLNCLQALHFVVKGWAPLWTRTTLSLSPSLARSSSLFQNYLYLLKRPRWTSDRLLFWFERFAGFLFLLKSWRCRAVTAVW